MDWLVKPSVYLETTIFGYLASWPSGDLVVAANQQITHQWWGRRRQDYQLYVSDFVLTECGAGDPSAAEDRSKFLAGVPQLDVTEDVETLADELLRELRLPPKAAIDASHIAVATIHGMNYLLTWNCAHIANAALRHRIESVCRLLGYDAPTICTPQELMED